MQPHREIAALVRTIVRCNPLHLAGVEAISTAEIQDWPCFLSQVERHRITPLCFAVLKGTGAQLPREAETMLTRANERHCLLNFARAAELLQVLDAFQAARIDAIAFKGVALGAQLYDDFNLRAAGDLDLLVRWEDLARASEIILGRGYELKTSLRPDRRPIADGLYEYHFERAHDGMILELHWNLNFVHPRFPHSIGLERIGKFSQAVQLAGRKVRVPDAEMTFLLLCMHGTKHQWSRLNWVCDVAQLLRRAPNLDWDRIEAEARPVGLRKAVALGLLLAHSICGVAGPAEAIRKLDSFPSVHPVAERLARAIPEPTGQEGRGFLRFHARLMDRPDLLRFLFSRDAIRPTANDEAFLSLPPALRWLHILIRPFRLLRDRSVR